LTTTVRRFEEFSEEDRGALEAMAEPRFSWMLELKKTDPKIKEFMKSRWYYPQLAGMVGLLLDQVAQWAALDSDQKQALADGVHACATPFGPKLFGLFLTKQPDLMGFFTEMLKDAQTAKAQVEITQDSAPTELSPAAIDSAVKQTLPLSLFDLYRELFDIAQKAQTDAGNLHYAEQIDALIIANLPRLKQEYSLGEEAIRKILGECIGVLESIGRRLSLVEFEDEEFLAVFRSAWLDYFNTRLMDEVPRTLLSDVTASRQVDSENLHVRLKTAEEIRLSVDADLAALNERLLKASFREKSELRNSITQAEELRVKGSRQHQDAEQDGYSLLLPPGLSLDSLPDGHDVALTIESYHSTAKAALEAWSGKTEDFQTHIDGQQAVDSDAMPPTASETPPVEAENTVTTPAVADSSQTLISSTIVATASESESESEPEFDVDLEIEDEIQVAAEAEIADILLPPAEPAETIADGMEEEGINVSQLGIPRPFGHLFHEHPATDSTVIRPPIPRTSGHP
jgi:hypothetical protein